MIGEILGSYEEVLYVLAKFTIHTLEIIGICTVLFGVTRVLLRYVKRPKSKRLKPPNAVIGLGRSLALALEFKMGAEIVNTVIISELRELLILGIIILLRAILAVLIHWEITTEEKDEIAHSAVRKRALERESEAKKDDQAEA